MLAMVAMEPFEQDVEGAGITAQRWSFRRLISSTTPENGIELVTASPMQNLIFDQNEDAA